MLQHSRLQNGKLVLNLIQNIFLRL